MSNSPPSSPVMIPHPLQSVSTLEAAADDLSEKQYPMELAKSDNEIINSVLWHQTTRASMTFPAAEKLVLKKATALLDSFAENFQLDRPIPEELSGVLGSTLECRFEKALSISGLEMKNTETLEGDDLRAAVETVLDKIKMVTKLACNLIETVADLCLKFSEFIGDLEGLKRQIIFIQTRRKKISSRGKAYKRAFETVTSGKRHSLDIKR